jgi:serine/threonine protein kinase
MSLDPGTRLGPYEVLAPLGAGGKGEVYRARDPRLGRDVAVKVLPSGFSADAERLHRFEQEARAAAALNHPNILAVHSRAAHGRRAPGAKGRRVRGADGARPRRRA